MRRKRPKKRKSGTRKRTKPKSTGLPRDIKTVTAKGELRKRARSERQGQGQIARDSSIAAALITEPTPLAASQLENLRAIGLAVSQQSQKKLPEGPVPQIEKKLSQQVVQEWEAALPPSDPSRLFNGSVRLNPQTSLRAGTY